MTDRDQFGPSLRRERERRGITLQDIATRTKISASFFEAMERNDFSRWPAGIFRRSFVRSYAEVVGLDGEEILKACTRLFPTEEDGAASASPVEEPTADNRRRMAQARGVRSPSSPRGAHRLAYLAALAIAVGVLIGIVAALVLGRPYLSATIGVGACALAVSVVALTRQQPATCPAVESEEPAASRLAAHERVVATRSREVGARPSATEHHVTKRRAAERHPTSRPSRRPRPDRRRPRA